MRVSTGQSISDNSILCNVPGIAIAIPLMGHDLGSGWSPKPPREVRFLGVLPQEADSDGQW
jgi:hypothetical protein